MSRTLRLATMNVLNDPRTFSERVASIGDQLRLVQPDVLCLQEAVTTHQDGTPDNTVARLADRLGMTVQPHHTVFHDGRGIQYGNITLTRPETASDASTTNWNALSAEYTGTSPCSVSETHMTIRGESVVVFNVHLSWGAEREDYRLAQVASIVNRAHELRAANPQVLCYVLGDFNTEPDSASLRYLTGKDVCGESRDRTFWVDAWEMLHQPSEDGHTSRNEGSEAVRTALSAGIVRPDLLPQRRIDYVLGLGWLYGRVGSPVEIKKIGFGETPSGLALSDHYGLLADIWLGE